MECDEIVTIEIFDNLFWQIEERDRLRKSPHILSHEKTQSLLTRTRHAHRLASPKPSPVNLAQQY